MSRRRPGGRGGRGLDSASGRRLPRPGVQPKDGAHSYDTSGHLYTNLATVNGQSVPTYHDFQYGYLSGEIGIVKNLSLRGVVTYLYGLEGAKGSEELNYGLSDAWIGLKYGFRQQSAYPMAAANAGARLEIRTLDA